MYCYVILATVNQTGSDCPYSLKLTACQLLLEITSFLRETYQHMPRSRASRHSGVGLETSSYLPDRQATTSSSRRWSFVLGSPDKSERSNSRSSQGDSHGQGFFYLFSDFGGPYKHGVSKSFWEILQQTVNSKSVELLCQKLLIFVQSYRINHKHMRGPFLRRGVNPH